ncbi:MAG: hypothetical protein ACI9TV_000125 [Sulfurimonas sp.]|jgi:hypothetical protein|uniref:hypothetical protein n=1 Tax=Sulfurimonas sp. TaxID=2022749 RepID=UPI0039E40B40
MAIDWDEFDKEIDSIIEESAQETDEALASKISSITRMNDTEIQELFPNKSDAKKLTELMKIVESAEDDNVKVNKIVSNAEKFGEVVFTLLKRFA